MRLKLELKKKQELPETVPKEKLLLFSLEQANRTLHRKLTPKTMAGCDPKYGADIEVLAKKYQKLFQKNKTVIAKDRKERYYVKVMISRKVTVTIKKELGDISIKPLLLVVLTTDHIPSPMLTFYYYRQDILRKMYFREQKRRRRPPCQNGINKWIHNSLLEELEKRKEGLGEKEYFFIIDDRIIPSIEDFYDIFNKKYKNILYSVGVFFTNEKIMGGLILQNVQAYRDKIWW